MRRLSLDDARLLPHLRADREQGELPASAALDDVLEVEAELVRRRRQGRVVVPSAGELRGLPVVGSGPGAIAGTNPVRGGAREGTPAGVSSRPVRLPGGRPVAVEITTPLPELEVGYRFRVLGDELRRPDGFGFTGELTGRPPLPDEAATVHRHVGRVERTARAWTDAHRGGGTRATG